MSGTGLSITVVICTVGEHPRLDDSVRAVLSQTHQDLSLVVVDNKPATGATSRALSGILDDRLTIVEEPLPGLSRARNRGVACAGTDLIAFTDDDAIADPTWIAELIAPFEDSRVDAVTGLVLPAELRTPAQRAFESYVGFSKGDRVLHWMLEGARSEGLPGLPGPEGVLFPWSTGKVGSGNNMAFRTAVLLGHGGFDVALGAGTLTQGGEDLDAFSFVLTGGGAIVYVPTAVVRHYHRNEMAALDRQIYGQGLGMGALLTKAVLNRPLVAPLILARSARVARTALGSRGRTTTVARTEGSDARRGHLLRLETRGLLAGPWLYLRSRRATRDRQ